jgi:hypothetical protein
VSQGVEVVSKGGTKVSVSQGVEVGGFKVGSTPLQKSGVTSTVTVTVVVVGSHSGYASYIANTEEADSMRERAIFELIVFIF